MKRVYLLTGGPGVGKTTIIRQALLRSGRRAGGFYTEEIRAGGSRQGFRIVTLDGNDAILAHVDIGGDCRVGKYGIDLDALDRVAVSSVRRALDGCDLVVVDEIGRMELFSPAFRSEIVRALYGENGVLGTIMLAPHPWADEVKNHPDVEFTRVTRDNRGEIAERTVLWLRAEAYNQGGIDESNKGR
ncbi:nucleoside-triphosphatase [Chloroflexota bacterium]